jgi:hypothetical protein
VVENPTDMPLRLEAEERPLAVLLGYPMPKANAQLLQRSNLPLEAGE